MATNKNEETGVIMKIQKQSGCLLIVIGAAMLAFVLTDLLKSGPSIFSGSRNVVGEIAGDKITYEDYSEKVEGLKTFYQQDLNSAGDDEQFREMAWNQLLQDKINKVEHQKLGISVGAEELKDLTTGAHPDPSVVQAFQDTLTKELNRGQLIAFLEGRMQEDPRMFRIWYNQFEVPIRERTEQEKYTNLVKAGVFVNKLEAQEQYDREHYEVGGKSIGISYETITDSSITYSDSDLKSYLKKNAEKYKQDASRDIQFVTLNVFPSKSDTAEARDLINGLKSKFMETKKDSLFVTINRSSTPFDPEYKPHGSFDPSIESQLFNSDTGTVIGPVYANGTFSLYKVTDVKYDSVYSIKARHVLIPLNQTDDINEGNKIMAQIRSGAKDFNTEAANNYDGTAGAKGDLGWVRQTGYTDIPSDLRDALFKHNKGDWFTVKTSRGISVVNITEAKTNKTIQVAQMSATVQPGNSADQEVVRMAAEIQIKAQENENFLEVVESMGQRVREAKKVSEKNPNIPGLSNPREVSRWLFDKERKQGDVSDPIDFQDRYVVVKVTAIRKEGVAELDDVREILTADYIREKKAEQIIEQINKEMESTQDPEELAKKLNTAVQIIPTVSMMSPQVTGVGAEPEVQGYLLGLPSGKHSKPIKGVTGVYVVWNAGQVTTGDQQEYRADEMMNFLRGQAEQMVDANVLEALKAKAKVVDNRYKFF
ncbi:MAG: hypothetical protein GC181_01645 [Bacteroidetes bacterium]|nr:hypothetical protein [Bacteroidota bacterium]